MDHWFTIFFFYPFHVTLSAIQKTSTGEVLVQVSLVTGDLHLCMLSDDDFTEVTKLLKGFSYKF